MARQMTARQMTARQMTARLRTTRLQPAGLAAGTVGLVLAVMTSLPVKASEDELCIKARMWENISRPDAVSVCACINQTITTTDVSDRDKAQMRLAQASLASAALVLAQKYPDAATAPANERLAAVGVALAEVGLELFDFVDLSAQFDLSACVE